MNIDVSYLTFQITRHVQGRRAHLRCSPVLEKLESMSSTPELVTSKGFGDHTISTYRSQTHTRETAKVKCRFHSECITSSIEYQQTPAFQQPSHTTTSNECLQLWLARILDITSHTKLPCVPATPSNTRCCAELSIFKDMHVIASGRNFNALNHVIVIDNAVESYSFALLHHHHHSCSSLAAETRSRAVFAAGPRLVQPRISVTQSHS